MKVKFYRKVLLYFGFTEANGIDELNFITKWDYGLSFDELTDIIAEKVKKDYERRNNQNQSEQNQSS